jgi:hypothetical protein
MPRFDKTGPNGEGPMTGRRTGKCTNFGGKTNQPDQDAENTINETLTARGPGINQRAANERGAGTGRGWGNSAGRGWGSGFARGTGGGRGGRKRGLGLQNRLRGDTE